MQQRSQIAQIHFHPQSIIEPAGSVRLLKRCTDIAAGIIGLTAFGAILPLIALAIKLDSRGPIFYRQERIGQNKRREQRHKINNQLSFSRDHLPNPEDVRRTTNLGGAPFMMYKLRTMRTDAEVSGPQLCKKNGDPRITRVGVWLRFFHIDELPQFWNVLKGDMCLIGPRPERAHFTKMYMHSIPHYEERLRLVKPGLTGLAQITLGYDESLQTVTRKVHYDLTYRLSLAHLGSYLRMESWVVFNTVRYLCNQILRTKLVLTLSERIRWNQKMINFPRRTGAEVNHPIALMRRVHAVQRRSPMGLPTYMRKIKFQQKVT